MRTKYITNRDMVFTWFSRSEISISGVNFLMNDTPEFYALWITQYTINIFFYWRLCDEIFLAFVAWAATDWLFISHFIGSLRVKLFWHLLNGTKHVDIDNLFLFIISLYFLYVSLPPIYPDFGQNNRHFSD